MRYRKWTRVSEDMMEGGKIYNPGNRNGRTIQARQIDLKWDGNVIGAVIGPDPVEGVPAYAETVHDALKELATNLIKEAVRVQIPHERITLSEIRLAENLTLQSNCVRLYRVSETQVCAVINPEESNIGVWGLGNSVAEAVRDLGTRLAGNSCGSK